MELYVWKELMLVTFLRRHARRAVFLVPQCAHVTPGYTAVCRDLFRTACAFDLWHVESSECEVFLLLLHLRHVLSKWCSVHSRFLRRSDEAIN